MNTTSKLIALCIVLPMLAMAENQQPQGGGQNNNGGAGVYTNGVPQTFYSAGRLVTDNQPATEAEILGMRELVQFLNTYPNLSAATKVAFLNALVPGTNRVYYRVRREHFDEATRQRIADIYAREKRIARESVALLAVTDTNSGRTFLLPEFFELRTVTQKMAILFHEAYWKLHPNATYDQVITAEMTFQAMLENPQDPERAYNFIALIGSRQDRAIFALNQDRASGVLRGLTGRNDAIPLRTLFGNDFFVCRQGGQTDCAPLAQANLYNLESSHRGSYFLRLLREKISAHSIQPNFWFGERNMADVFLSVFSSTHNLSYSKSWLTESISMIYGDSFYTGSSRGFRVGPFDSCSLQLQVSPMASNWNADLALLPLRGCRVPREVTNVFLGL